MINLGVARATLLVIDDEQNIITSLKRALGLEGFHVIGATSGHAGLAILSDQKVDGVLLDVSMPEMNGLEVLEKIKKDHIGLGVIMMSGQASIETAVKATQLGAFDFCEKPLSTEKLLVTLKNCIRHNELALENHHLKMAKSSQPSMIGESTAIKRLWSQIQKVAPTQGRVLILGENGTGKEMVAKAIHDHSKRKNRAFIKINCAAIPKELIESELFGHEKGAFTGATELRKGKFELADGGTLLLDEIGDMPLDAQAKVLRCLQEGELERVGGQKTIKVDVRVLAATNKNLEESIKNKEFREDLYYRLNVVPLESPPLRERASDIPLLVDVFLKEFLDANNKHGISLSVESLELLKKQRWPGNVRELRNVVERLVIFSESKQEISPDEMAWQLPKNNVAPLAYDSEGLSLKESVLLFEKRAIERALEQSGFHVSNTAKALGVERSHLYKKMKAHGIESKG